ncbi:YIP1 family protein [Candidatus Woesearchaeota archaeon]|nr:YIP1 family protein [Candidatus Woesearchaeota archaeon]
MEFVEYLQDAWKVVTFDEKTMSNLSKDKNALIYGLAIALAVSLLSAVVQLFMDVTPLEKGLNFIILPVTTILGTLIIYGLTHLFAKWLGGKADFMPFYKVLLFPHILMVLNIFPFDVEEITTFGVIMVLVIIATAIWSLLVDIKITKVIHQLSIGRAVAAVLISSGIILTLLVGLAVLFINSVVYV